MNEGNKLNENLYMYIQKYLLDKQPNLQGLPISFVL